MNSGGVIHVNKYKTELLVENSRIKNFDVPDKNKQGALYYSDSDSAVKLNL
jgi:ribosomal protein L24